MRYALILLFLSVLLAAACGSTPQNSTGTNGLPPVTLPESSNTSSANANCTACSTPSQKGTPPVSQPAEGLPALEPVIKDPSPNFYMGCWMAGDTIGISITDSVIQTNRSRKPLRYKDVTDEAARAKGMRVFEIARQRRQ